MSFISATTSLSRSLFTATLLLCVSASNVWAEPTVTVNDPTTGQPIAQNTAPAASNAAAPGSNNTAVTPNGMAAPNSVAAPNAVATNADGTPAAPIINPNSLAAQLQPTDNALSAANQKLLSQNAELQRQVNDLQTQVNVLIYESKGQLFLYGAFTVIAGILVGIFIAWLVFVRRQRW